jgi:hypothetical protein
VRATSEIEILIRQNNFFFDGSLKFALMKNNFLLANLKTKLRSEFLLTFVPRLFTEENGKTELAECFSPHSS